MEGIKKVLFISYDGMTDPLGQSQVIPYLQGLTKFGYHFTILSCDKPLKFKAHEKYVRQLIEGYPIKWVSIPYHKNPPVISSAFDYYQLKKKAITLHKEEAFDMVHTRPGIPTLVALWVKKNLQIKFLNDVRGFWADERVDGGMWDLKNPVYKKIYNFFKNHEYECLELADYNTCLTHAAKKEMLGWNNIKNQQLKIEVIPCSVDLELFDPQKITSAQIMGIKKELNILPEEIVFSYLGSIGGWYLTNEMMELCSIITKKNKDVKFLFISPHRHEQVIAAAALHGVPVEKIITRSAERHEVPLLLSLSDYSIFFIKPCYSKISSSPTKHGEIMAMGIPLITNTGVGDVSEIVERYQSGYLLNDLTKESMEKAAAEILVSNYDRAAIRIAAMEYYALQNAVLKYRDVYALILN
ncbi:MAG: glycosyltransferase [Ferruginibacter sp.]